MGGHASSPRLPLGFIGLGGVLFLRGSAFGIGACFLTRTLT